MTPLHLYCTTTPFGAIEHKCYNMSHPNYLEASFRSQVIERYYNFRKGKFNLSVLSAQRTDQASKNLIQRILRMDGEQDEEKDCNLAH